MNAEVKSGYKLTEIGVIPEDWDVSTLDSLGRSGKSAIKAGPFGSSLTKNIYVNYGYKVYGQEQVIRGDYLFGDYFITKERFNELKSCSVESGDILLSLVGTAGRVLIIPPGAPAGIINPRLIRFSFDRNSICPAFFKSLIETDAYQSLLSRSAQGGTMGVLNAGILKPLCIPLPSLFEQEAIAEALSDADTLIESLEQLITKKRQIKQGAMQELLTGKKRLPGFSGEWEVKSLGEISITNKGSQLHDSESTQDGTYPHLNGGIAPSGYAEKSNTPANTIAVSEGGNSCGYVQLMKVPYWCGGHCYSIISNCVDNDFLYHALKAQQMALMGLRVGSGLPNVQKTALLSFKLCYPSGGSEQIAIAEILMDMDSEIEALEVKLEKAHQLKQGMMRKLLTGQIRLVRLTKDSCKVSDLCSKFK